MKRVTIAQYLLLMKTDYKITVISADDNSALVKIEK